MQKIKEVLSQSIETSRRMKKLLILVTAVYAVSFIVGILLVYNQVPFVVELVELITEGFAENPVFTPIIGALETGNLALAILYTFLVNLTSGAFTSTTLPGVIPLLGGVGSVIVTGVRGFLIGAIFYYAGVFEISMGYTVLAVGTLILELGAYVFSAAAGINLSLSTIFPSRYQVDSRWTAFKLAWIDAGKIYVIVIILLALGAIWEMAGIYISLP